MNEDRRKEERKHKKWKETKTEEEEEEKLLLVDWLFNVPATGQCISGTDLLGPFYVLPH